jgi:hypothetical protein
MAFGIKTLGWRKLEPSEQNPNHRGQWAVIHDGLIVDTYPTQEEAYTSTKLYANETLANEQAAEAAEYAIDSLIHQHGMSKAEAKRRLIDALGGTE